MKLSSKIIEMCETRDVRKEMQWIEIEYVPLNKIKPKDNGYISTSVKMT